jgi:hypothetical protein
LNIGSYHRQSNVRNDDSVQSTGGVLERLALITTGMVLVLVDLAVVVPLPGHRAVGNANVALGCDGGGLLAEVPFKKKLSTNVLESQIAVFKQLSS